MKNIKMVVMAAGIVAGAELMALAVILIFGMGTGAGGAALILATIAVAGGTGFLMGILYRGRKTERNSYRRRLPDGLLYVVVCSEKTGEQLFRRHSTI